MLDFPIPHPDELLYSVVARAGVRKGITSPKQLLDEVFVDRSVIATVDLPNRLQRIKTLLPMSLGFTVERLAYENTLFPIYAPFTIEERRSRCLKWMEAKTQGAVHLCLGVAASRVKKLKELRYCPQCLDDQVEEHGEYFWNRQWQVYGADVCPEHGVALETSPVRHSYHRHQFFAASPVNCTAVQCPEVELGGQNISRQVRALLNRPPAISASFSQWSQFYKDLAEQKDCTRGKHICYGEIKKRIQDRWSPQWLRSHGLQVTDSQACWLRGIFRKHRKSFSYLEHIVVLDAFLPEGWCIDEVLNEIAKISDEDVAAEPVFSDSSFTGKCFEHRTRWLRLLKLYGVKQARMQGGGASYAWLYRHDRAWLRSTNRCYRVKRPPPVARIDWKARDISIVRTLIRIRNQYESRLESPRWTKRWFLSHVQSATGLDKKLDKLPLTRSFLDRFCEDIADYQIRRMTCAAIELLAENEGPKRWRIFRMSGLSEDRLREPARNFLQEVLECR